MDGYLSAMNAKVGLEWNLKLSLPMSSKNGGTA